MPQVEYFVQEKLPCDGFLHQELEKENACKVMAP
jgi:hypothetical protein